MPDMQPQVREGTALWLCKLSHQGSAMGVKLAVWWQSSNAALIQTGRRYLCMQDTCCVAMLMPKQLSTETDLLSCYSPKMSIQTKQNHSCECVAYQDAPTFGLQIKL